MQHEIPLTDLLSFCAKWLERADGVTISGGEPFDQPEALAALVEAVRARSAGDLLIYSGYSKRAIEQNFPGILAQADVLISEPYRRSAGDSLMLRGSDNQRITLVTPLARQRYPEDINNSKWAEERRLDVLVTDNELWVAGIPRKGEMARLKKKLRALGYDCVTSDQPEIRA